MKPDTRTVRELFELDVRYLVPLYQRPYVWNAETQWQPLWEDIEAILEHRLNGGGEFLSHFLGAVVFEQELHAPGAIPLFTIIDGQQRLTTLQILIAAACNVGQELGVERQAAILGRLMANDELTASGVEVLKVWPTNANRAAFEAVMQPGGPPPDREDDPNNRIDEAYNYFCETIREWLSDATDADDVAARVQTLRITISDLLKVVSITLEPGENAQIIFETLNARGTPLLALDLVKNAVFHAAEQAGLDTDTLYHCEWEPELDLPYWRTERRQGRLYRPRADLFLMHWLTMKLREVAPANELFSRFRQRVLGGPEPPAADALIRELRRDAAIMRSFDEYPEGSVEGNFFDRLVQLDTSVVLPVVLLLFREKKISVDRRNRALRILESWLVRRALMRLTVKNYNEQVPVMLDRLSRDPEHADEVMLDHLRSGQGDVSRWPTDDELTKYLTTRPMYGNVGSRKIVMALAAVEQSLYGPKVDIPTIPKRLSLEHVLPQKWEKHWPLPLHGDKTALRERREEHVHRLGNLTLTAAPLNSALLNAAWLKKRVALNKHAKLLLNAELVESYPDAFDEDAIDARSNSLAMRICAIWPGPQDWKGDGAKESSESPQVLTSSHSDGQGGSNQGVRRGDLISDETQLGDLRTEFWRMLLARDQRPPGSRGGRRPPARGGAKMNAGGGMRGYFFNYFIARESAGVELFIDLRSEDANDRAFALLEGHRTEIEERFSAPLSWERAHAGRSYRISASLQTGGYEARDRWADVQSDMIDAMNRLRTAVRPHLDPTGSPIEPPSISPRDTDGDISAPNVLIFKDDDDGFFDWMTTHPHGYFLNTTRTPNPNYLVLHLPGCRHFKGDDSAQWTKDYIKVCSDEQHVLEDWANMTVGGEVTLCRSCFG